MEEEKAAAYYEELNRKGESARRFKQGLGFSSDEPQPAAFTSKPTTSSSSFLSGFVRAGATPAQLPNKSTRPPPPPEAASRQPLRRSRSPSPSRARPRSRSPSRSRRRRSRSRSRSRERRRRSRSRDRRASHHRSRSRSPSHRSSRNSHDEARRDRHGDRRRDDDAGDGRRKGPGSRDGGKIDYSRLIQGFDKMTPAERVKAKMKLQLSETASKDSTLGTATVGWGRFEFNKDAPLDEDDNGVEGANDDATLVKHIGRSFRLSAVESKNENIVRDAHDEAMFGVPTSSTVDTETSDDELKTNDDTGDVEVQTGSSLISDEVLAMQKGSWRERIQKLRQNSNT